MELTMRLLATIPVVVLLPGLWSAAAAETVAQALVARTLAAHPELRALTLHVDTVDGRNVVAASNVAPLGKPADDDDVAVRNAGAPVAGLNPARTRFGVAMKLRDRDGAVIGTVNLGYPPRPDVDGAAVVADAATVVAGMERQIGTAASLFAPAP